ncbi:Conserved Hypothetical protein, putative exported protein [Cupriavidus taiwanensis]|uniref:Uncharacterized protein n=1 Tax=Cupriavidus taiwanensis TaxID=164546 RepID=A0A375E8T5_9BURK|nr:DUF6152 family protein [Cupriavidus taiwanensis]SOZ18438.1 Conserved Hypothetical protein, putative exported protein [Cupriavidus taiwanensis]SOZ31509.1 Conserved Hypothetical protein, putative exported protein [Cupriavidus taiwanensis]SOZ47470.1 Conserved Hypothetical protein, putative exported protein [Cupriavidus taiwanensis]SOZ67409.1 Conserved Hypothetical protein, putative exported protein [Cupriavidus taiwanensis]SOZ68630.1 Conserved Hypothetical protein, putative exported protein [C
MPSIRALFRPTLHRPILGAAALVMAAVPALAHHGWSTYDETKPMTLTGKIVESHYENPHAHIRIDAGGKRWLAVLAPVSRMEARGATSDKVAVGREVTLVGYASKDKPDELRAERITVDGKTVELR